MFEQSVVHILYCLEACVLLHAVSMLPTFFRVQNSFEEKLPCIMTVLIRSNFKSTHCSNTLLLFI